MIWYDMVWYGLALCRIVGYGKVRRRIVWHVRWYAIAWRK
jgi:hypothetical protein